MLALIIVGVVLFALAVVGWCNYFEVRNAPKLTPWQVLDRAFWEIVRSINWDDDDYDVR